jgi:Ceramidase
VIISARQILTAAGFTLLAVALIWLLLTALGPDWAAYSPATCTTTRCFCEFPRSGALIVQPANSWSSFGYAFGGFLMIVLARGSKWRSGFPPVAAQIFGVTAIFVGLGSVLLHATLTLWGQFFDVMGMYLVSGFMAVSAIAAWRGLSSRGTLILYLAVLSVLISVLALMPEVRRWLYAVVLLVAIFLELFCARAHRPLVKVRYYAAGIAAKALAFTLWILDQQGTLCEPESLIQGHAAWHLLGASALWLTFLYYRSEAPRAPVHSG